jgi:hypothetical protein
MPGTQQGCNREAVPFYDCEPCTLRCAVSALIRRFLVLYLWHNDRSCAFYEYVYTECAIVQYTIDSNIKLRYLDIKGIGMIGETNMAGDSRATKIN